MKTLLVAVAALTFTLAGCAAPAAGPEATAEPAAPAEATTAPAAAAAPAEKKAALPPVDENNILSIAIASPDHTTLVAAIQAADLTTAVAASGPLTVFAPTNAGFDALPPGTVEDLLKPENLAALANILKYHVAPAVYDIEGMREGMKIGMANGDAVIITLKDGQVLVNEVPIVSSIRASNGIIHILDSVLLPPEG